MVMPQLNVNIPEDLNEKVRMKAGKKYGAQKTAITMAVIEALNEWVNKPEPLQS
jgi:hypothetical protein